MKTFKNIQNWANTFENKAVSIVAFYTAIAGALALIPSIIAGGYWFYLLIVNLLNISTYVKEFKAITEEHSFQIMQLTHIAEAETDPKRSYGVPIRMTNPPEGHEVGDLWYFTNIKINGIWRPITYGAFPNKTKKNVGILDMNGTYRVAGTEEKPLD